MTGRHESVAGCPGGIAKAVQVAANLVHWFKRLCLELPYNIATVDTIRTDFLVLPAKLVRSSKRNLVKLPKDYPYRKEFGRAAAIKKLKLPGKFRICRKEEGRKPGRAAKVAKKP